MPERIIHFASPLKAMIDGYNGATQTAAKALRYLSEHDRPSGGEAQFNCAHLQQTADELDRSRELTSKAVDFLIRFEEAVDNLRDAKEFFDRVKNSSADERMAVGTDHYDLLEKATMQCVAMHGELKALFDDQVRAPKAKPVAEAVESQSPSPRMRP